MANAAALAKKICPRCGSGYDAEAVFCPKDGARLEQHEGPPATERPDPHLGAVIAGDVELRGVAGVGAMGRVYRAHQRGIERDVAVKIIHPELSGNAQLVQRFHREAKIASKLQHPHVVEVYLAGQLPDGALYIVMEYLDGMSLAAALTASGDRIALERALSITLQICDAVGEGHARGIVHRDLKPENVMLVRRAEVGDWVKVLDFGIARIHLGEQSMETAAGLIFGTARYISPEGAQGVKVGPQGDVYAIATMLYQMLAGRTPFDGEPLGMLVKHIHEAPPPLTSFPAARDVPEPIASVVMANLSKDPKLRAPTARAFGSSLASAAKQANVSFSDVGVLARMSMLPEPEATVALEPTLDDAAAVPTPPPLIAAVPAPPPIADAPAPERRRSLGPVVIPIAFLLGVGGTIVATRILNHEDAERSSHIERARHALTEGHYVAPPGENVKELVAAGLARWPSDATLEHLRSEAEHEMITMAIAARSSGDLVGARDLARDAYGLDPTDNSARYMRAQSEDELAAIEAGAGLKTGPPRLLFESPPVAKPGQRVEISCRILPGAAGTSAKIGGLTLTIRPNGKQTSGTPVSFTSTDPSAIRAVLTAPEVGSYDVSFEASVDGIIVRAMRDLDIAR